MNLVKIDAVKAALFYARSI